SGATKRTVYNNFGSKERLLEAVVDHSIELLKEKAPGLPPDADLSDFAAFAGQVIEMMTWRDAVGLQRLIVSERAAFPDLAQRLVEETGAALVTPVRAHLQARGMSAAEAAALAATFIEHAAAAARLDRLIGTRPPYPELPGGNNLDTNDLKTARAAANFISKAAFG
ncbi:MAG: TetR/AcrR family transcriptional regulator, partial [Geminicoccaceae bacterium]